MHGEKFSRLCLKGISTIREYPADLVSWTSVWFGRNLPDIVSKASVSIGRNPSGLVSRASSISRGNPPDIVAGQLLPSIPSC